jgi:hypothetical protein
VESLLVDRKDVFYFNAAGINNQGHLVGELFTKGVGWKAVVLEPVSWEMQRSPQTVR